jgi:hypothetical protein
MRPCRADSKRVRWTRGDQGVVVRPAGGPAEDPSIDASERSRRESKEIAMRVPSFGYLGTTLANVSA